MAETDTGFAERVCALLSADINVFTPEMLNSFDFRGTAEILVKKAVPDYEDILSGDDEERKKLLESCIVLQTAILLAPNVKKEQIKVQQTTHAKVEYFDSSAFDELLESLKLRLMTLYEELNGSQDTGFSFIALTNPEKRFYGAGFDI